MTERRLSNTLKARREQLGVSQKELAARAEVSRQAIVAIEAGRQVPSTALALGLARSLGCQVEDLFRLSAEDELRVQVATPAGDSNAVGAHGLRLALGRVDGEWVGHRLALDATTGADGIPSPRSFPRLTWPSTRSSESTSPSSFWSIAG